MIDDRVDARAFVRGQLAFSHPLSHHGQRIRRVGCGCQLRYVDGDRRVFPDWRNALKAKPQRSDVAAQPQLDCLPGQSLRFPEKESLDRHRGLVPRAPRTARVAPQESARFGGVVSFLPRAFAHGDAPLSVTVALAIFSGETSIPASEKFVERFLAASMKRTLFCGLGEPFMTAAALPNLSSDDLTCSPSGVRARAIS